MQDKLFGPDAVGPPTWSVADLTQAMGRVLEGAFPGEIWVQGEIRNLPPPGDARRNRPHVYFDLIEPGPPGSRPAAVLSVVLFSADRKRVNSAMRRSGVRVSAMDNGVDARIRGRVRWWAPSSRAQLQMTAIDPEYTLGRLAADRTAVLAALEADGLLDRNRGLTLPVMPEKVGLVTSLGSAAHADVRRVLEAAGLDRLLVEADARTQGPEALTTVPAALTSVAAAGADVVLLVRGGGSRIEMSCFDAADVARAVARCPVPVITGIGHQIDDTVADRVAHTSCPTPTAAATAIVSLVTSARDRSEALWVDVTDASRRALAAHDQRLAVNGRHATTIAGAALRAGEAHLVAATARTMRVVPAAVATAQVRLDSTVAAISREGRREVVGAERALASASSRLSRRAAPGLDRRARDLDGLEKRVRASDPVLALARGWSITYRDGRLVRTVADTVEGAELVTVVADGQVRSRVTVVGDAPIDGTERPVSSDG